MNIAILGFGNPVREDDAVGVYAANQLKVRLADQPNVEVFDMGTSAFEILYKLKEYDHLILVDAVLNSNEPVGTLFKLPAEQIQTSVEDDPMVFLHSLKWDQALSYARKMLGDDYPSTIEVYLIAIDSTRFNTDMTQAAKEAADRLVDLVTKELQSTPQHAS